MNLTPPLSDQCAAALAIASIHDRIVGALFGSALGDAIGLYTEFLSADLSAHAYPSRKFTLSPSSEATPFRKDNHRDPNEPGEWTDDTDHAMLIVLSYLHTNGREMNPADFAKWLDIWVRMGLRALDTLPLGLGRTVGRIVSTKTYLDDPQGTAREVWVNSGYNIAPNGSVMRTHPIGLMCLNKTCEETFQIAADYSVVTHVDPRCIISCSIGSALVRGLVRGEVSSEGDIDDMVEHGIQWYRETYRREELVRHPHRKDEPQLDIAELRKHAKVSSLDDLQLDDGYTIGYVYKTFGSGIHLLRLAMRQIATSGDTIPTQAALFEPLITDLIMHGGDADTNACFAGALLGAFIGCKVLPPHWRDGLKHGDWLMEKSVALCKVLGVTQGTYDGALDKDTALDGGRGFLTDEQMREKGMKLQKLIQEKEKEAKMRAKKDSKWF